MKILIKIPRIMRRTPELKVPKKSMIRLNFSIIITILWHISNVPEWSVAGALLLCFWRLLHDFKKKPLPSKKTKILLTVIVFLAIIINFRSFLGRDPGITALILLSSLKMLELKSHRDFMLIVYLCFFLLLGNFLYDQSIASFMFMILITLLLTTAILSLNRQEERSPQRKRFLIKTSLFLLFQAIPLTVILFLFFPRTPGFYWNLRQRAGMKAYAGFRDRIVPGEVARIALSKETAFRVVFPEKNMPSYKDLYFRGLVLWYTDGEMWFQGSFRYYRTKSQPSLEGSIRQEILLEPHNKHWLFALDTPYLFPSWARRLPGQIFLTRWNLRKHVRYEVESSLNYQRSRSISSMEQKWALQLPRRLDKKISELTGRWKKMYKSNREIVNAALDFFRRNNFVYTLTPGRLDPDKPVEDFLFNSRRGFCEHFASSFTLLMRSAGIPSRVIVGYHGGKFNTVGNYLVVRQMDAHAWSEVWIENEGWKRIDPTSVVAPERVNYGIEISNLMANEVREDKDDALRRALQKNIFKRIGEIINNLWDTIKINWSLWIISYDRYQQWSFLRNLGFIKRNTAVLILIIVSIISLILFFITFLLKRDTKKSEPVIKLYRRFCKKFERSGFRRFIWEGPMDFKLRASSAFPEKTESIHAISDLYIELRYGRKSVNNFHLRQLKKSIKKLKV